jgi:5'-3' exonuclease
MTTQVLPIDSLMKEVSALIERELYQMLDKYMANYKKYKKTHKHIMKLPAVRKLKEFKKTKEGSKGNKGIIRMLVNQINELTAEISSLKTALYTYESIPERREQENISLKITEPTIEDLVVDSGTKVYAELIENTQPQQTHSNITQTKVVKLDAVPVVSEGDSEEEEE